VLLPEFEFHEPSTLPEACEMLDRFDETASLLAGGTDLLVNMKKRLIRPDHVISLAKIDHLTDISRESGSLKIGPCVTAAQLVHSDSIRSIFGALAQGAGVLGSPLIRNLATIGGNVVSARPAADLPPSLMAYGARVVCASISGERSIDLNEFFTGPGKTVMGRSEILTRIEMDIPEGPSGAGYMKLGVRETLEISLVNVAAFISLDGENGPIKSARVVLGSVGPTPIRAPSAERVLAGQRPSESVFADAGAAAARDCTPIDDFRGSAEYRRDMVQVLTKRALSKALNSATADE
jgi:carbon-monoxide dehydrogenase medium subunit